MKLKVALLTVCCLVGITTAKADITLTDGNASLTLHESAPGMVDNMTGFVIDGTNQLDQQWFWYRTTINNGSNLNLRMAPATVVSTTANSATLLFQKTGPDAAGPGKFDVTITISLTGGALLSHEAWLTQSITATNTSPTANLIQIFQYSDYNLDGTAANQQVTITGSGAIQTHVTSTVTDSISPNALHYQSGEAGDLLTQISTTSGGCNVAQQNLCDTAGTNAYTDAAYAFQWRSPSIAPGADFTLTGTQANAAATIPEPGTTGLIGGGLVFLALAFRKKLRRS